MALMKVKINELGELNFIDGNLASADDYRLADRNSEIFDMVEEGECFLFQEGEFVLDRDLNPVQIKKIKRPLWSISVELSPRFLKMGYEPKQKPKHFLDDPIKKEIRELSKIIKKEIFKILLQDGWEAERYLGRKDGEIEKISKGWSPGKDPIEFVTRARSASSVEYFNSNYSTGYEGYGEYIKKVLDQSLLNLGLKEEEDYGIDGETNLRYFFHKRIEPKRLIKKM